MMYQRVIKRVFAYPYTYSLIEEEKTIEELGKTRVYGIEIKGDNERSIVEDISCEKSLVESLFDTAVEEGLCPVHLIEVAEDLIA